MERNSKIYVAGHRGMVGSAIVRELQRQGYVNIITRTHKELDLTRQEAVEFFLLKKNLNMFSWQQQKWEALWLTKAHWQILCTTI